MEIAIKELKECRQASTDVMIAAQPALRAEYLPIPKQRVVPERSLRTSAVCMIV